MPLLGLLLTALLQPVSAAADASQFRGGPAHTGVYPGPAPRAVGAVRWSFPTEGPVRGAATVAGGAVFVGSGDGHLYALDEADGRVRWAFETGGAVTSTPAVAGSTVYVTSRDGHLYALDAAGGRARWRAAFGPDLPYAWGFDLYLSSPTVHDGAVYVGGGDGHVYAFDADDGARRWAFDAGARVRSSPAVADGAVYVGSMDGRLFALDAASGRPRWTFTVDGAADDPADFGFDRCAVVSSPAVAGRLVLFGSRDGNLYALDRATGREVWRSSHGTSWVITSPAAHEGTVYAGSSDGAFVQAVDLATGAERWRYATAGTVWSSPAVAGGLVFVGSGSGTLYALDAATGALAWRLAAEGPMFSSPVLHDGVLYVGSDGGHLYALTGPSAPDTAAPALRAVFWEEASPVWFRHGADRLLAAYFERQGYERLDGDGLAAFMAARLADRRPSVVVFASNWVPGSVLAPDTSDAALLRQYLAVGRAVWLGSEPLAWVRDPATGALAGVDFTVPARVLGLRYAGPDTRGIGGYLRAEATDEGRRRGLRGWWVSPSALDDAEVTTVLARDEYGRAAAWEKTYGGPPGTGLLQLWVDRDAPRGLDAVQTAAEFGLR
jgi:outer membrane protein assembly factor BamB